MITEPQEFVRRLGEYLRFEPPENAMKLTTQFCAAHLGYVPRIVMREFASDDWPPEWAVMIELADDSTINIKYAGCSNTIVLDG